MGRSSKCTYHECNESDPSVDHNRKYHTDSPVRFTSIWDALDRVLHRSCENMAYYCDHPNCNKYTYLTSGPLQHHNNCSWYKAQYNGTPVERAISSSFSTVGPAAPSTHIPERSSAPNGSSNPIPGSMASSHTHAVGGASSASNPGPSSKKEDSAVVRCLDDFQVAMESKLSSVVEQAVETSPVIRKQDRDITNLYVELHKVRRAIDHLNWNLGCSNDLFMLSESTPTRELSPVMQVAEFSRPLYLPSSPASTSQTADLPGSLASGVSEKDFSGLASLYSDLEASVGEGADKQGEPSIEPIESDFYNVV
ncbi:unnamed protein product [Mortierella alpina]